MMTAGTIGRLVMMILLVMAYHQSAASQNAKALQGADRPREIFATNISFDAKTGKIKYTLPERGLVQIRIGIKEGGPLLRNLLDWEERGAGDHFEVWDFKDSSGQVDFGRRDDLKLVLMCIPKDSLSRGVFKGFKTSPRFHMVFSDSKLKNGHHVAIVSGVTNLRIRLDEKDKMWLSEARYEIKLFIDNVFLMEDEEGTNPFTYKLDSKMMNNGVHVLTVNLAVYDGEVGTESVLVAVKN